MIDAMADATAEGDFYVRYYVGHAGKFGHEFLEFEFRPDGRLRYANNSNYKGGSMIRKEVYVSESVIAEVKKIVEESEIVKEDDKHWPEPNRDGRQEFEVVVGNQHISFATAKIGSLLDVQESTDPEGLRIFYYLVQDLKCLAFSLSARPASLRARAACVTYAPNTRIRAHPRSRACALPFLCARSRPSFPDQADLSHEAYRQPARRHPFAMTLRDPTSRLSTWKHGMRLFERAGAGRRVTATHRACRHSPPCIP